MDSVAADSDDRKWRSSPCGGGIGARRGTGFRIPPGFRSRGPQRDATLKLHPNGGVSVPVDGSFQRSSRGGQVRSSGPGSDPAVDGRSSLPA